MNFLDHVLVVQFPLIAREQLIHMIYRINEVN